MRFADEADVRHRIVFLPDYDMSMARYLYWGCDVWLNNPLRPLEACGTSGMKSALNGGLNLSIRDGWWDEMYDGENGWAIPTADGVLDDVRRDDLEASALYELLEHAVLPTFYDRDAADLPTRWVERVRHTLENLGPKVLASRMVRDYAVDYYAPSAESARAVVADDFAGAREVAEFRRRIESQWPSVAVEQVDGSGLPDTPGDRCDHLFESQGPPRRLVGLGCGGSGSPGTRQPRRGTHRRGDVPDDTFRNRGRSEIFEAEAALPVSGSVGYTVRVLPHHRLLVDASELGW